MIAERSRELVESLRYKEQLEENVTRSAAFQARAEEIAGSIGDLMPKIAALRALRSRGLGAPGASSHVTPLLQRVNSMRRNYDADPSWIIDSDRFNPNPFRGNLRGLQTALDTHISQAWARYTAERMPPIGDDLLNLFWMIPDFAPTVRKVRDLIGKINDRRNKAVPEEADFSSFDGLVREVEDAWAELKSDDLPESVMHFLRSSAGHEGAPLETLTGEVVEWLGARGITGSFRIRMAAKAV